MNRGFYTKLAFTNIKKNSKTYIPYILTCICTIMMFYMVRTLAMNEGLMNMTGGQQLSIILELGSFVVGIFSLIFLFYTNSFLIKRRKKEFGLFNILGMEKKHISKIMTLESVFVGIFSFIVGILGGIVLTKLMYMLLCKLLQFEIPLKFDINLSAIIMTAILFLVIFLINLLNALRQVQLAKPIELLAGGNVGEKEPKTKWIMAILGFLTLGAGYYIAVSAKNPVEAMGLFFVAVILVIIGTELLFIAGSIAILKILRKNKRFYYQTKHFTTVSGMMYRMKQNAAGLSNICILSTMVIIMIAGTVSLYVGMNDVMRTQFPRNIVLSSYDISNEQNVKINEIIKDNADKFNVNLENQLEYHSFGVYANQKENAFYKLKSDESMSQYDLNNSTQILFLSLAQYNKNESKLTTLNDNELLVFTKNGILTSDTISISGKEYEIKQRLDKVPVVGSVMDDVMKTYVFIVKNEETIKQIAFPFHFDKDVEAALSYVNAFDIETNQETEIAFSNAISEDLIANNLNGHIRCMEESVAEFYAIYGGLFFLGIFLGLLFIMATVLIIYYKQISEGYDDQKRFNIMQKVGMSHKEVKKSIHSQVLTVFFLPIVMAIIHVSFAFPITVKLLALLGLLNTVLFAWCTVATVLVFLILYAIVYTLTAKTYYKIVKKG